MINIKPFKQTDDSRCGPACIKMILSFYGVEASEDEICERCNWTYELGCTDLQMKAAFESYGFQVALHHNCSLDDLEFLVKNDIPAIVDWFSPGVDPKRGDMPEGHSSIVVAIDSDYVYLLDPELGGLRAILRNDFMRVWFDWREDPYLQRCEDLVLRQAMFAYPKN